MYELQLIVLVTQKYDNQYSKANSMLSQLKAGYDDLGEPLEDQFMNIEDFLTDEKCVLIINRMKDVDNLKVVFSLIK